MSILRNIVVVVFKLRQEAFRNGLLGRWFVWLVGLWVGLQHKIRTNILEDRTAIYILQEKKSGYFKQVEYPK